MPHSQRPNNALILLANCQTRSPVPLRLAVQAVGAAELCRWAAGRNASGWQISNNQDQLHVVEGPLVRIQSFSIFALIISFYLIASGLSSCLYASTPKPTASPPTLTGRLKQEVDIEEAVLRYLPRKWAKNMRGTKSVLVYTGNPAVLHCLIRDGFSVISKEPQNKEQVCYVAARPVWRTRDSVLVAGNVDYYNPFGSYYSHGKRVFVHGIFQHITLRLSRRGGQWRVLHVKHLIVMAA